ncbi:MAG: beta-lactamase family protein [Deltaproteobacteria bacterium]|nr:beta-lactamase family protein [Deltaproteobacteria bacterium]
MGAIQQDVPNGRIAGTCDDRFAEVAREFARNFQERGEVGASVSLELHGETVVDLWGGVADPSTGRAWERDTVSIVFSCTKGATALCAHVLASRGLLDLDAPVKEYWPEFAVRGKERATVRMMLDHSAGVPVISAPLKPLGSADWDYMVAQLEAQEPFWKPGTRNGYHMINFGWTVGELVRRVSNKSLGAFFQSEIAQPLGIEFWIGAPESVEARVAPIAMYKPAPGEAPSEFVVKMLSERESIQGLSMLNLGFDANSRECHAAEIGGAGGISNARGLAGMYAPFACGGKLRGKTFVDAATLARMGEVAVATHEDATLLIPSRFGLGFMKSMDNRRRPSGDRDSAILSSAAFGHVGAGGSIGFADPREELSFGYSMNRMGKGILLNERGQSLVDAAYRALGYTTNAPGVWTKG